MAKLVSYGDNGQGILCGATVIDDFWLVTAAHCALQLQTRSFVYVREPKNNRERSFSVKEAYIHSGYNNQTADNDIALLRISSDLSKLGIKPVCLVHDDSKLLKQYKNGVVIGYGLTLGEDSSGEPKLINSQTLQSTSVPIISDDDCVKTWRFLSLLSVKITGYQICAGAYLHGTAPGDSGGPLLIHKSNGEYVQIGITSYGADGLDGVIDQGKFPGVYTRISKYVPWIQGVIGKTSMRSSVTSSSPIYFNFLPIFSIILTVLW
ncbi:Peptidase S1 domain-containing protein [Caenorhabditis elegans]|nr:Peptidase S1 domain-containing protein [Caenorhabditis elegans]CDK13421.1 Peptidase S1 domain-containing protein [Caenorhabditis elegans]|eukprot:NP_001293737.1 TRYpsin-like protease [Caenorhabditis elegans]